MNRAGFKKVLAVGVAIFGLGLCAMPASAGWGWHGGCCGGWYGGYPSCGYGCGCSTCGYGWGGCSSCGYYGWSGCSSCGYAWGGYGYGSSCCGTSVAYSGCGCSTCGGGQTIEPAGTAPTPPTPPPSSGAPGAASPGHTSIEAPREGTFLTVLVPDDAKVTINGMLTKSSGSQRLYVSYGLRPGTSYAYQVKAEVVRGGKVVTDEQTVSLTAGTQRGIAFGFHQPSVEGLATTK